MINELNDFLLQYDKNIDSKSFCLVEDSIYVSDKLGIIIVMKELDMGGTPITGGFGFAPSEDAEISRLVDPKIAEAVNNFKTFVKSNSKYSEYKKLFVLSVINNIYKLEEYKQHLAIFGRGSIKMDDFWIIMLDKSKKNYYRLYPNTDNS